MGTELITGKKASSDLGAAGIEGAPSATAPLDLSVQMLPVQMVMPPRERPMLETNITPISFAPLRSVLLGLDHPPGPVRESERHLYRDSFELKKLTREIGDSTLDDLRFKLIKVIILAQQEWKRASVYNPDYESAFELVELFTRASSKAFLCIHHLGEYDKLAGAGLAITDARDFHDSEHFPNDSLDRLVWSRPEFADKKLVRGVRIFSAEYARYQFMGKVTRHLMDRLVEVAENKPILTCIAVKNGPSLALVESYGFERTGDYHEIAGAPYAWLVHPPFSGAAANARAQMQRGVRDLEVFELRGIAPAAGLFAGKVIAAVGSQAGTIAPKLQSLLPGRSVLGIVPKIKPRMVRQEGRHVRFFTDATSGDSPDAKSGLGSMAYDGIFLPGTLEESGLEEAPKLLQDCFNASRDRAITVARGYLSGRGKSEDLNAERLMWMSKRGGEDSGFPQDLHPSALFDYFMSQPGDHSRSTADGHSKPMWSTVRENEEGREIRCPLWLRDRFYHKHPYWKDYAAELAKPSAAWDRDTWVKLFTDQGFRVLWSMDEHNPWIKANRWDGKLQSRRLDGTIEAAPPTGHVIAAMKVAPGEGVRWAARNVQQISEPTYLKIQKYDSTRSGRRWELVQKPTQAIEFLPVIRKEGGGFELLVLDTRDRPIGIMNNPEENFSDGRTLNGYLAEQIGILVPGGPKSLPLSTLMQPGDQSKAEGELSTISEDLFRKEFGLGAGSVATPLRGLRYYSSPGGLGEVVVSQPVHVDMDTFLRLEREKHGSGRVRSFDAQWALRASHTGAWSDGRLERAAYHLLHSHGESFGPWLGAPIALGESIDAEAPEFRRSDLIPARTPGIFRPVEDTSPLKYLAIYRGDFSEFDSRGEAVASQTLELVKPADETGLSTNTVATLPVFVAKGVLYVVLEERNLPCVQEQTGSASIFVAPAKRMPRSITDLDAALNMQRDDLRTRFGIETRSGSVVGGGEAQERVLGTSYNSAIGVTPEVVIPTWMEVDSVTARRLLSDRTEGKCRAFPLNLLMQNMDLIRDGHTVTLLYRLAHAVQHAAIVDCAFG